MRRLIEGLDDLVGHDVVLARGGRSEGQRVSSVLGSDPGPRKWPTQAASLWRQVRRLVATALSL